MHASPVFDVVSPGAALLAGGLFFAVFSLCTLLVETLALWLLKWGPFGRSLLAAFVMNLASTMVGFVLVAFSFYAADFTALYLVGFVLSVWIEGAILMLFKKGAARQNWIASLVANVASYGLLAIAWLGLNLL